MVAGPTSGLDGIATLTNNTLENNAGSIDGGGLWLTATSETETASLYNNLFWNNHAPVGGDLWINNDSDGDASRLAARPDAQQLQPDPEYRLLDQDRDHHRSDAIWTSMFRRSTTPTPSTSARTRP